MLTSSRCKYLRNSPRLIIAGASKSQRPRRLAPQKQIVASSSQKRFKGKTHSFVNRFSGPARLYLEQLFSLCPGCYELRHGELSLPMKAHKEVDRVCSIHLVSHTILITSSTNLRQRTGGAPSRRACFFALGALGKLWLALPEVGTLSAPQPGESTL